MQEAGASSNTHRVDPHWDDLPIALTDGNTHRPRLRVLTAAAAREGIRAGMTVAEARALCAELDLAVWDDVAISDAITHATAMFVSASPQVSPVAGAPGMWWIGASGFTVTEREFAAQLLTIARSWHPRARVAIANSCVAARAATWSSNAAGRSISIIPPNRDAAYLASAPLALLPLDPEMRDALRALGIRTVGDLADLDAGDVEQRWGDDGLAAWRLSHGDDPRRPVLARFDAQPHVEMELASPAATMEPVLFLVRPAVERLVNELVANGRAIASLSITLTLDDARGALPNAPAHTVTREIRMPRPLARAAPLFERCRGLLARWPLTAQVVAVRLTVLITSPLTGEQGNLLDTSWRDPGAADAALERVRAELGADVVVKPATRDAYAPERNGVWKEEIEPFSAAPLARFSSRLSAGTPIQFDRQTAEGGREQHHGVAVAENQIALRILATPEQIDVDRDDEPRRIFWRGRAITVLHALGPERLSGDWWNDGYSRDYWRCESDDERGELMLYRDASGWYIQGWYD